MPQIHSLTLYLPNQASFSLASFKEVIGPKPFIDLLEKEKNPIDIKTGFNELCAKGIYRKIPQAKGYWFRIRTSQGECHGFISGISTHELAANKITVHESVLPERVQLFSNYLNATNLQAEPLLMVHEKDIFSEAFDKEISLRKPEYHFSLGEKVYQLWELTKKEQNSLENFCNKQEFFHLADGHHRLASSLELAKVKASSFPVQCLIMGKKQLKQATFIWALKEQFYRNTVREKIIELSHQFSGSQNDLKIELLGSKYSISVPSQEVASIFFIKNCLGMQATSPKIKNMFDYYPTDVNKQDIRKLKNHKLVVEIPKISIEKIITFAKQNKILPPKSTLLNPKIHSGLLISPVFN